MYSRWQTLAVKEAMDSRRVVALTGARQCGKTTLVKALAESRCVYRTLDDPNSLEIAQLDQVGFVTHEKDFMIIDEIQRVPNLLLAIKMKVDDNKRYGQYLITGSANIFQFPKIQDSLAGRIKSVRLRTLSQGEVEGTDPVFLDKAFERSWLDLTDNKFDRASILKKAFLGGFPEPMNVNHVKRMSWYKDYVYTLLNQDIRILVKIKRPDVMEKLIQSVMAWSGKYMNVHSIGTSLEVQRNTLDSYLNTLENFYLIERLSPWVSTDYEYVNKQHKLFATDSGLITSLLGWNYEQVLLDPDRSGKLMETFVFNQLASLVDASLGKYTLYHYRDNAKREVDFIIEREDGALLGIEVKSSASPKSSDANHLKWFGENMAKNVPFTGIVLYAGEIPVKMRQDDCWAVPIASLWGY